MKKVEEKRIIPSKNYLILGAIFIAFILLIMYLCNWYQVYNDYMLDEPIIRGRLATEITYYEMEPYLMENPNAILYLCTSYDDSCRNFEKEFAKFLDKEDYSYAITHLNLNDINQHDFVDRFNARHSFRKKLTTYYPTFIVFHENRVIDILQGKKDDKLTISEVRDFLRKYKLDE